MKAMQAKFLCMGTTSLCARAPVGHWDAPRNTSEIKRKAKRFAKKFTRLSQQNEVLPTPQRDFERLTQRGVKSTPSLLP